MTDLLKVLYAQILGLITTLIIIWTVIIIIVKNSQIAELGKIALKVGYWISTILIFFFLLFLVFRQ